jgi:hypothetical protein
LTFRDRTSAGFHRDILPKEVNDWWEDFIKELPSSKTWAKEHRMDEAVLNFFKNWHDKKRAVTLGAAMDEQIEGLNADSMCEAITNALRDSGQPNFTKRSLFEIVNKTVLDMKIQVAASQKSAASQQAAASKQAADASSALQLAEASSSQQSGQTTPTKNTRTSDLDPPPKGSSKKKKRGDDKVSLDNPFNNQHGLYATLINIHFFSTEGMMRKR